MKKDIAGLIACRGGSTRVPNKNIKSFGNSSLLEIKIQQLKHFLTDVYVNSDSDEILEIAEKCGAIPMKRDSYYATNDISINEVYANVSENVPHDHILYAHVTSPLIELSTIKTCITTYNELPLGYDSICTVQELKKFLWYQGNAINYDINKMPRSQDLPDYHIIAFAINILPKNLLLKLKNIVTPNYYPIILNDRESIDIDTQFEFDLAEYMYTK